jgi:hypothetical protein
MFPLSFGSDSVLLAKISGGAIWMAALFSSMLSLDRLFRSDYEDGSLEQLVLSGISLEFVVITCHTEEIEKCTRLHVEIVAKIVKYHSSQNKTNQYTAMIVFKIINQQEIRKRLYYDSKFY